MEYTEKSYRNFNPVSIHFRVHDFSFWFWLVQVGLLGKSVISNSFYERNELFIFLITQ